jgi:hypothetical protein
VLGIVCVGGGGGVMHIFHPGGGVLGRVLGAFDLGGKQHRQVRPGITQPSSSACRQVHTPPPRASSAPSSLICPFPPLAQDVWLTAADGTKLHAWLLTPRGWSKQQLKERPVMMFFQENAGNMSHRLPFLRGLARMLQVSIFAPR